MKFLRNMYVTEAIASRKEALILKIKHNRITPDIYVLAYASNPKNLLEIIPTKVLLQNAYPKKELYIIGLAKGKQNAFALTAHIIEETYMQTKNMDVRAYLAKEQEEEAWE